MTSTVGDPESSTRDNEPCASVSVRNALPAILDEKIIGGSAAIQVVRQWLKGSIPGRGKIIQQGLSGAAETVVEEERIHPFHTFCVEDSGLPSP